MSKIFLIAGGIVNQIDRARDVTTSISLRCPGVLPVQVLVKEDMGAFHDDLKGVEGDDVGILFRDEVAKYVISSHTDPMQVLVTKATNIPLEKTKVLATATVAEALAVVSSQLHCEGVVSHSASNDDSSRKNVNGIDKNRINAMQCMLHHFYTYDGRYTSVAIFYLRSF